MTTPTRAATANDLGERCQIIIGSFGYVLANKPPEQFAMKITPMTNRRDTATYISTSDHLTMRDSDESRVFMNDWRRGSGQQGYLIDDPISKARFFDSSGMDVSDVGRMFLVNNVTANANGTSANTTGLPLVIAGSYLYMGDLSKVLFSTTWTGAATSAATSAAGNVVALESDGQYVYGAVAGVGINRWTINSAAAGTAWNATVTSPLRILWANRIFYVIDAASFYSLTTAGVATTQFTPPTGWTISDIAAKRGGAIDSPVLILARLSNRSFLWYWDGTNIHDYLALPSGFVGQRLIYYQGVAYVYGYRLNADSTVSPCFYYVQNDTLGFGGYFGLVQSNGDHTPAGVTAAANYALDAYDQFVYFAVSTTNQEIWRYDIINGGLTRYIQVAAGTTKTITDIKVFQNGPWATLLGTGLYNTASTYVTSGSHTTSDVNTGQPWSSNVWLKIEATFSALKAGEQVSMSYSTDNGNTFTSAGAAITALGATSGGWVISSISATVTGPTIRVTSTLTAGTAQATTPSLYSVALRFTPIDPSGAVIEAELACADDIYQPNTSLDWQGASAQERIFNIVNNYELSSVITVIYLASANTRGKNPKTISARVDNYQILHHPSQVKAGPSGNIEGTIIVTLREIL